VSWVIAARLDDAREGRFAAATTGASAARCTGCSRCMRHSPPKSTVEDLPRRTLPEPNVHKSSAQAVVLQCCCGLVERMDRRALHRLTREIWKRFDAKDLEPVKWAIPRRRRVLANGCGRSLLTPDHLRERRQSASCTVLVVTPLGVHASNN